MYMHIRYGTQSFFTVWVFLPGCFIQTTTEKHPGFQNLRTPFFSLYCVGVWGRGVFKINATSSLNFEISRRLSDLLLSTLRLTWMEDALAFSTQRSYVSEFDMCSQGFFPLMAILIHNFWESTSSCKATLPLPSWKHGTVTTKSVNCIHMKITVFNKLKIKQQRDHIWNEKVKISKNLHSSQILNGRISI